MSKNDKSIETTMSENNKEVEKEVKTEEHIPKKIQEAYDALLIQIPTFNDQEIQARTMKTKALGVVEVFVQMYPKLQEQKSDS